MSWRTICLSLVTAICLGGAVTAGPASADGNCGRHDSTGASACPLHGTHGSYGGSLTPRYDKGELEQDYFGFRARAGTTVTITLHDDETTACATPPLLCGLMDGHFETFSGQLLTRTRGGSDGAATVLPTGIAVASTARLRVHRAGTYFWVVGGSMGRDLSVSAASSFIAAPYSFTVTAHPGLLRPRRR